MINIDDLVRQRLGGGQEPERPGAWLNMKNLLDKEMPTAVASGSNRRRVIGYFTGLLLLATASVGGYKLYMDSHSNRSTSGGSDVARMAPHNASNASHTSKGITGTQPASLGTSAIGKPDASSANTVSQDPKNSSSSPAKNTSTSGNKTTHIQQPSVAFASTQKIGKSLRSSSPSQSETAANNRRGSSNAAMEKAADPKSARSAGNRSSFGENTSQGTDPANPVLTSDIGDIDFHSRRSQADETRVQSAMRSMPLMALSSGTRPVNTLPFPTPIRYRYDTVETIEIAHHRIYDATTQKTVFRIDTFPKGKVVVARMVPQLEPIARAERTKSPGMKLFRRKSVSSDKEIAIASSKPAATKESNAPIVPASKPTNTAQAPRASADEHIKEESLDKFKVASKHFGLWDAEKFEEAINKFKFNLARIQMYPGVMGGINASIFTPNSLGGFQLGLTSLFVLNDWWSLMTELKYMHRFNTGSTLRDDFKSVAPGSVSVNTVNQNGKDYKEYKWTDESVEHYFNYDVIRTFEAPLALRYNSGRFYTQGGINLVYSSKIEASEVTRPRGNPTIHRELYPNTHDDDAVIPSGVPLVKISDFGSRFGTGWVLGMGYMFTPAVYMDFRVAQTFWDNAKTGGAKQISNDLLRTPSIQLSVGYRFGQKP